MPADIPSAAYDLANELRERRKAAGFGSQDALARVLNCDRTRVTKAETGQSVPTDDLLEAWGEACAFDVRPWKAVARQARERKAGPPRWFEGWLDAEQKAHTLRHLAAADLSGTIADGRLRIARSSAAWAWTRSVRRNRSGYAREGEAIFDRSEQPNTTVVLDQAVLYRLIGSPQIMCDQVAHVMEMSERPMIMIHILPSDVGANAGLGGAIHIAAGFEMPEVLLGAALVEDQVTQEPSLVRAASDIFSLVRADAQPRAASRTLMLEALERWKSQ